MAQTRSTRAENVQNFGWKTQKEREHLRDLDVDSRVILNRLLIGCEKVDWDELIQERYNMKLM